MRIHALRANFGYWTWHRRHRHRESVVGANLPQQADPLHRSVSGGRQHRCGSARDAARIGEDSRPAGRGREPVRRRRRAGRGPIAKAAPDGYTIGIAGAGALGVNIGEPVKKPFDPAKDLALISKAAGSPFILVAPPTLNASSLGDVIKLAKAEPGRISIGHGGNGTAMHLAAMMLASLADVKINLVPYRGTAPAVADTIAGHVQLGVTDPPPSMGAISEGKLKALAVTSKTRFPVFPNVPTADEQGLKGFDVTGWFGIAAPGTTPPAIVTKLNEAVVNALRDPEVARRIRTIGMEPEPMTPEQFSAFIKAEIEKAVKVQSMGERKAN